MNTENIRQYLNEIHLGTSAENDELKEKLISDITEEREGISAAIETLEEMAVEITERLAQVEDEERIKELEAKQKLIEDVISALAEQADKTVNEQEEVRSVLVADTTDLSTVGMKNSVLVSSDMINPVDTSIKTTVDAIDSDDTVLLSEDEVHDNSEELAKEAAELIRKQKKKQAELEKEEKEKEKREREENKNKTEIKQTQDVSEKTVSDDTTENCDTTVNDNMDSRLLEALKLYHQKTDLDEVRRKLKMLSNDKRLSGEDLGIARFFYAEMLFKGEGGSQDKDQSRFWYEKATLNKNADAYLRLGAIYAEQVPKNDIEDVENAAKALKCFKKADKYQTGTSEVAKSKYIEVCKNKPITYLAKRKALKYCDLLAAGKKDEYERTKIDEERRIISENYACNRASKYAGSNVAVKDFKDYIVIFGALVTLLADYYIFMTLQNNGEGLWTVFGMSNPVIQKYASVYRFIVQFISFYLAEIIQKLIGIVNQVGSIDYSLENTKALTGLSVEIPESLILGMFLLFIGVFLATIKKQEKRGRLTEYVFEVAFAVTTVTIVGNIALYLFPGGSYIYLITTATFVLLMLIVIVGAMLASRAFRK